MRKFAIFLLSTAIVIVAAPAQANHVSGVVKCDTGLYPGVYDSGDSRVAGMTVNVTATGGTVFSATGVTATDGTFWIDLPYGSYELSVSIGDPSYVIEPVGYPWPFAITDTASYAWVRILLNQEACPPPPCSGAIGDRVWIDADHDGVQDEGELGIEAAAVTLNAGSPVATSATGSYLFSSLCAGSYNVCVQIPPGYSTSPPNQGTDDAIDSDGMNNGQGSSCVTVSLGSNQTNLTVDFGFFLTPPQPGVGTPGYWKNHPEAWPVDSIVIGGVTYSRGQAIEWMGSEDGDKTVTMLRSLVAATLNILIGNDGSCVAATIAEANDWLAQVGPVGTGVAASSVAWKAGEPLYRRLDNYNNGMLCAPGRD